MTASTWLITLSLLALVVTCYHDVIQADRKDRAAWRRTIWVTVLLLMLNAGNALLRHWTETSDAAAQSTARAAQEALLASLLEANTEAEASYSGLRALIDQQPGPVAKDLEARARSIRDRLNELTAAARSAPLDEQGVAVRTAEVDVLREDIRRLRLEIDRLATSRLPSLLDRRSVDRPPYELPVPRGPDQQVRPTGPPTAPPPQAPQPAAVPPRAIAASPAPGSPPTNGISTHWLVSRVRAAPPRAVVQIDSPSVGSHRFTGLVSVTGSYTPRTSEEIWLVVSSGSGTSLVGPRREGGGVLLSSKGNFDGAWKADIALGADADYTLRVVAVSIALSQRLHSSPRSGIAALASDATSANDVFGEDTIVLRRQ